MGVRKKWREVNGFILSVKNLGGILWACKENGIWPDILEELAKGCHK